jgi:hypothetical protein
MPTLNWPIDPFPRTFAKTVIPLNVPLNPANPNVRHLVETFWFDVDAPTLLFAPVKSAPVAPSAFAGAVHPPSAVIESAVGTRSFVPVASVFPMVTIDVPMSIVLPTAKKSLRNGALGLSNGPAI